MSDKKSETPAVFYIPYNYIDSGSVLGGTFKKRNAIEAGLLVAAIVVPLFKLSGLPIKTEMIISVMTALPLGLFALIGVNDGSLFEFIYDAFLYLISNKNIMFFSEYQHKEELRLKEESKHKPKHKSRAPKAPKQEHKKNRKENSNG